MRKQYGKLQALRDMPVLVDYLGQLSRTSPLKCGILGDFYAVLACSHALSDSCTSPCLDIFLSRFVCGGIAMHQRGGLSVKVSTE